MTLEAATDLLSVLAEPTRVRLLALLEHGPLPVTEIVAVTQLGQSRVSMHLAKMLAAGLVRDRREGSRVVYELAAKMPAPADDMWPLVRGSAKGGAIDKDVERLRTLERAKKTPEGWHEALAGEMEQHYSPGRTWESLARGVMGLIDLGDVLDVGSGDGALASMLAPHAKSITCLDKSSKMVSAAKKRLRTALGNVVEGDIRDMPFANASFDVVLAFNVLVYLDDPSTALGEARRVLRQGGRLVVVTLDTHEEHALAAAYGHANLGQAPAALKRALVKAGFTVDSCAVTSRERRPPHLSVVTAIGHVNRNGKRASS